MCVHMYNVTVTVCYPNVKKGDVVALTMHVMYVDDCDMTLQCRLCYVVGAIS